MKVETNNEQEFFNFDNAQNSQYSKYDKIVSKKFHFFKYIKDDLIRLQYVIKQNLQRLL